MEYKVIYSSRKTISLCIKEAKLLVRAPYKTSAARIETVIEKHRAWIAKAMLRSAEREERFKDLTDEKIKALKKDAKKYLKEKLDEYSKIMGLNYGRMTITSAKTRFGSCTSKKNISFSYRLMLYPEAAREYVVVHELAHLVHMNHSDKFWTLVSKYMPDYKERRSLLKK